MAKEWFRRSTWNQTDQQEFEARLKRAHPPNRSQYLRIQAYHLFETGEEELLFVALTLLDRVFAEYPDDIQLSAAHELCAKIRLKMGNVLLAVESYRAALEAERRRPNVRTEAWLDLGWLAIGRRLTSLYDEVLEVFDKFAIDRPFPVQRYKYHAIRALIFEHKREYHIASKEALIALDAASATHSGFRYHPGLGLVREGDSGIMKRLHALAAG